VLTDTLVAIDLVVAIGLIVLVLLHSGRGGGLSDMFGASTARPRPGRPSPSATSTGLPLCSCWSSRSSRLRCHFVELRRAALALLGACSSRIGLQRVARAVNSTSQAPTTTSAFATADGHCGRSYLPTNFNPSTLRARIASLRW